MENYIVYVVDNEKLRLILFKKFGQPTIVKIQFSGTIEIHTYLRINLNDNDWAVNITDALSYDAPNLLTSEEFMKLLKYHERSKKIERTKKQSRPQQQNTKKWN